jgi:hypothetical protein
MRKTRYQQAVEVHGIPDWQPTLLHWDRVSAGHYAGKPFPAGRVYRIDRHAGGWSVQVCDPTAWAEKPSNTAAVECIGDEYRTLDDAKAAAEKF